MQRVAVLICLQLAGRCVAQLFEGDACVTDDAADGVCTNIRNCPSALESIRNEVHPTICSFSGVDPIVCCVGLAPRPEPPATTSAAPPLPTTAAPTTTPATTFKFNTDGSRFLDNVPKEETTTAPAAGAEPEGCPPIAPNKTAPKTGQKAWDMCIEYQERLVLPCGGQRGRLNLCRHDLTLWILGGTEAYENEFPHMALVGYTNAQQEVVYQCGGSLISERFVLTAGHCATSRALGPISHVLLGVLARSQLAAGVLRRARAVHRHPGYSPPGKYNDIALVELDAPVELSDQLVPACLDVGGERPELALATGWGTTEYGGNVSDVLQKVELKRFPDAECAAWYPSSRNLRTGFNTSSQLCYGDPDVSKDTCQGDSGGPLQVAHAQLYCMYRVVGVTSFGHACGVPGDPALYTRVAHYLPWLEALVWPDP